MHLCVIEYLSRERYQKRNENVVKQEKNKFGAELYTDHLHSIEDDVILEYYYYYDEN